MADEQLLETNVLNFAELVGNGRRLEVPPFQRDYAWTTDNWEDLWTDLARLKQPGSPRHYMGSVVLQQKSQRTFLLIDGQQRIGTLSLLAYAVITRLRELADLDLPNASDHRERAELLRHNFLASKDPTSLVDSYKLKLNRHSNDFFQKYLLEGKLTPLNRRQLNDSEKLLLSGLEFFQRKLKEHPDLRDDGEALTRFLNDEIALRTLFIQVKVQDEVSAYTVFETLNARGTELTPTDLLKNYVFSLLQNDTEAIEHLEVYWQNIGELVGSKDLPEFVRHFMISSGEMVRSQQLFRHLQRSIRDGAEAMRFIEVLENEAAIYQDLQEPDAERWRDLPKLREALQFINLLSSQQALPPMMAVVRRLPEARWAGAIQAIAIFLFRFSKVGQRRNNEVEKLFAELASKTEDGQLRNATSVQEFLAPRLPNDEHFINDFTYWSCSDRGQGKELVKYLLEELEREERGGSISGDLKNATLEHIIPLSERRGKEAPLVRRFGNYALLEERLHRPLGSKPYRQKVQAYQQSEFRLTRQLSGSSFDAVELEKRQKSLGILAASRWRLNLVT